MPYCCSYSLHSFYPISIYPVCILSLYILHIPADRREMAESHMHGKNTRQLRTEVEQNTLVAESTERKIFATSTV